MDHVLSAPLAPLSLLTYPKNWSFPLSKSKKEQISSNFNLRIAKKMVLVNEFRLWISKNQEILQSILEMLHHILFLPDCLKDKFLAVLAMRPRISQPSYGEDE